MILINLIDITYAYAVIYRLFFMAEHKAHNDTSRRIDNKNVAYLSLCTRFSKFSPKKIKVDGGECGGRFQHLQRK